MYYNQCIWYRSRICGMLKMMAKIMTKIINNVQPKAIIKLVYFIMIDMHFRRLVDFVSLVAYLDRPKINFTKNTPRCFSP